MITQKIKTIEQKNSQQLTNGTLLCSVTESCKYDKYSPDHFVAGTENSTFV